MFCKINPCFGFALPVDSLSFTHLSKGDTTDTHTLSALANGDKCKYYIEQRTQKLTMASVLLTACADVGPWLGICWQPRADKQPLQVLATNC